MVYRQRPVSSMPVGWCGEQQLPNHLRALFTREDLSSTRFFHRKIDEAFWWLLVGVGLFWMMVAVAVVGYADGADKLLALVPLSLSVPLTVVGARTRRAKYLHQRGRYRRGLYLTTDALLLRGYSDPIFHRKSCLLVPRSMVRGASVKEFSTGRSRYQMACVEYEPPGEAAVSVRLARFAINDREVVESIEAWLDMG